VASTTAIATSSFSPGTGATGRGEGLILGFLTVLHEPTGYIGGYLVTNVWSRPLEFRLSTSVQPNRVQQILYGGTLQPYICADLIGKTLIEKTSLSPQLILTDREAALDLRLRVDVPVAWLATATDNPADNGCFVRAAAGERGPILCHASFPGDVPVVRELLHRCDGTLDVVEPFSRIREAIGEARKMGVTQRG
jgi:hypothetical protein